MKIWFEGKLVPEEAAALPVNDHGFLFGANLFETFRTYRGSPFLLEQHLARLRSGCDAFGIDWRQSRLASDQAFVNEVIRSLLLENQVDDAVFRITVSAGTSPGGIPAGPYREPREIVFIRPLPKRGNEPGVRIHLLNTRRLPPEFTPRPKSAHFITCIQAHRELQTRRSASGDEGLMLTPDGRLSEGVTSNIFLVINDHLLTPDISAHLLPGITRDAVLRLARELNIESSTPALFLDDIEKAAAVFITNSLREITPATEILTPDGTLWRAPPGPSPIVSRLITAYRSLLPK